MEIDVFINTSTSQHKVIEKTMQVVQAHLTRFTRNYISTLPPSFQKYMPNLKTREMEIVSSGVHYTLYAVKSESFDFSIFYKQRYLFKIFHFKCGRKKKWNCIN